MTKKILLATAALALGATAFAQNGNVGIGTTTPNADAKLDITATNKGLLLPRVALTGTANSAPLSAHVAGMTVYNTKDTLDVTKGTYYNNGIKWIKIGDAANAWSLTGNAGTTPGTNYLGTKDSNALVFKTNATNDTSRKMVILPNGYVGMGIDTPKYPLHVFSKLGNLSHPRGGIIVEGDNDVFSSRMGLIYRGEDVGSGTSAYQGYRYRGTKQSPTAVKLGDQLVSLTGFGYDGTEIPAGGSASVAVYAAEDFSTNHVGGNLVFRTTQNGIPGPAPRMTILHNGNVGIGTTTPTANLELMGRTFKLGQTVVYTDSNVYLRPIIESNKYDLFLSTPRDDSGYVKIQDANTPAYFGISANGNTIMRGRLSDAITPSPVIMDINSLLITDSTLSIHNSNKTKLYVSGRVQAENLVFTNLPVYATDTAADADIALPSGSLYRLTGSGRQVFIKP